MKDGASGILKRVGNEGHGSLEIKIVPPPPQDASEELRTNATRPPDTSRGENGLPHSPSESQLQPQPQHTSSTAAPPASRQAYLAQMSQASSVSIPSVGSSVHATLADSPFSIQRPLESSEPPSTHPVREEVQQRISYVEEGAPSMPVASDAAEETLRPETSCSSRDGSTDEKVTDIKIHPNTNAADPKLLD